MKQRTIGVLVLAVVMLATLSIPQGLAQIQGKHGFPAMGGSLGRYSKTNLRGVSNAAPASPGSSPASCGDLGFTGKYGLVMYNTGSVVVLLQHASSNTQYTVWLGHKTSTSGCDGSWTQLGSISTNGNGNGGFSDSLSVSSGTQYQVVVRDQAGNTIYATAFFTT
jgi:hypothetical protein